MTEVLRENIEQLCDEDAYWCSCIQTQLVEMQLLNILKFTDHVQLRSQAIGRGSVQKSGIYKIVCLSGHKIKPLLFIIAIFGYNSQRNLVKRCVICGLLCSMEIDASPLDDDSSPDY